jgi:VWFA-related protein
MVMSTAFALLQLLQTPIFPSTVQMVGVTITATDERTGAPVTDLKSDDFVMFDEGKRQAIVLFEREEVPASVVILLDTSISVRTLAPAIREAATNLIRALRPIDEVHVAAFDDRYRVLCEFTTDHDEAIASLKNIGEGDATALNRSVYTASRFLELQHRGDIRRRRILILLSDGEDTLDSFSYDGVEEALRRSSVVCYVVHLRRGPTQRLTQSGKEQHELTARATRFVESITYETGGKLLSVPEPYPRLIITGAFSGIAADIGSQYHVGYLPSAEISQGGWRSISVALTSRSGVRLRFRKSYYVAIRE